MKASEVKAEDVFDYDSDTHCITYSGYRILACSRGSYERYTQGIMANEFPGVRPWHSFLFTDYGKEIIKIITQYNKLPNKQELKKIELMQSLK